AVQPAAARTRLHLLRFVVEALGPPSGPSSAGSCLEGGRRGQPWLGRCEEPSSRAAALASSSGQPVGSCGFSFNDRADLHANVAQCALLLFNQAAPLFPRPSMLLRFGQIEIEQRISQTVYLGRLLPVLVGRDILIERILLLGTFL